MRDLVELDGSKKVIGVWLDYTGPDPQPGLFDVTGNADVPGRDYMGWTYVEASDAFTNKPPAPPQSRRERLIAKDKATASVEDVFEALQELLKSR